MERGCCVGGQSQGPLAIIPSDWRRALRCRISSTRDMAPGFRLIRIVLSGCVCDRFLDCKLSPINCWTRLKEVNYQIRCMWCREKKDSNYKLMCRAAVLFFKLTSKNINMPWLLPAPAQSLITCLNAYGFSFFQNASISSLIELGTSSSQCFRFPAFHQMWTKGKSGIPTFHFIPFPLLF